MPRHLIKPELRCGAVYFVHVVHGDIQLTLYMAGITLRTTGAPHSICRRPSEQQLVVLGKERTQPPE